MRLRDGILRTLRRLEPLQARDDAGTLNSFVWNGTEYVCTESRERVGLVAAQGGFDQVIQKSIVVRLEVFGNLTPPASGHLVTLPEDSNREYRVLAASPSPVGSHITLDLGEPENQ